MMLLDTNALLWIVHDSPQLGARSRRLLEGSEHTFFSAVSVSEIAIKHALGQVPLPGGERFPQLFRDSGLSELPFTAAHAAALLEFAELTRHDPFDRMLLAQAKTDRLNLLTSDAVLLGMGLPWVLDARA